ncbi:MAG: aminoacyl-tRNA hydrolase [Pirellula sp.]
MTKLGSVVGRDTNAGFAMVVGLGNPGAKYERTRHNIGFDCLNILHAKLGAPRLQAKFEGQFTKVRIGQRDVVLLWPMTFMNCSGRCVSQFARFYKIEIENILVICDDLSLPLGKLRIRKSGSSGGQKGLNDIIQSLGTLDVPRLRIGIDPTPEHWDTVDYVLSKFSAAEMAIVEDGLQRAAQATESWLIDGIDVSMNAFNRDSKPKTN